MLKEIADVIEVLKHDRSRVIYYTCRPRPKAVLTDAHRAVLLGQLDVTYVYKPASSIPVQLDRDNNLVFTSKAGRSMLWYFKAAYGDDALRLVCTPTAKLGKCASVSLRLVGGYSYTVMNTVELCDLLSSIRCDVDAVAGIYMTVSDVFNGKVLSVPERLGSLFTPTRYVEPDKYGYYHIEIRLTPINSKLAGDAKMKIPDISFRKAGCRCS